VATATMINHQLFTSLAKRNRFLSKLAEFRACKLQPPTMMVH